jgi:hypothetical protein
MKDGKYFVKPWKLIVNEFGLETAYEEAVRCESHLWTKTMESRCPKDRIINVKNDYWEDSNEQNWLITPSMLVGPAFEWGETAEFSDGGKNWYKNIFVGITPGIVCPYKAKNGYCYKYARPLDNIEYDENDIELDEEDKMLIKTFERKLKQLKRLEQKEIKEG